MIRINNFRRSGDMTCEFGFRLAIETGYPDSVMDSCRLIRSIDHPQVGATMDVGRHKSYAELVAMVKPQDNGTPEGIRAHNDVSDQIIDELGSKIVHMHVRDIEPDI